MSLYSRLDRVVADQDRLERRVDALANSPQSQRTSVEGGSIDFNDADGNLMAVVGGQDDGSTTVRHVDGPVPPIPSGLTAHVDGPIIQVSWDGSFEDGDTATHDWSHLEVIVVGPSNEQLTATINDITGASTSVAATVSGVWTVVARSVSRAEKRSLDGDAGAVEVEIVGLSGAIEAAVGSANGKNTVTYSETAPTPSDEGIVGDTWWVGQVGRPNDIVEGTNLIPNPSFEDPALLTGYSAHTSVTLSTFSTAGFQVVGARGARAAVGSGSSTLTWVRGPQVNVTAGQWLGMGLWLYARAGSSWVRTRVLFYNAAGGAVGSGAYFTPFTDASAGFTRLSGSVQVPVGAVTAYTYFYTYSSAAGAAPVSGTQVSFDGWFVGEASSEANALALVQDYFDGDTESGITENDPHYRWSGTPHASTSQKYLPAIVGSGSDVWNITEQWQFTSSGWAAVELSHQVIATVDLGKATVGELDGIRITAQSIRGVQLSGDAIDGKVVTGGTYRTTGGTGSWSDDGLFIAQPDGTSMVRFPTDGSPLSLTASDVQIDRASVTDLDLSYGSVRSGGSVTLASGVTAPTSPPELTTGWQKLTSLDETGAVDPGDDLPADRLGLAYWAEGDGHWVRAVNVLGSAGDSWDRIEVYDYATGEFQNDIYTGLNPRSGVTVIGDIAYVMGPDYLLSNKGKQWVHGFNLNTGLRVTRWEYVHFFDPKQKKVALGSDGTNLLVAGVAPNATLYAFRYNPATGAQVGSQMTTAWDTGVSTDLHGVGMSGGNLYVSPPWQVREYTVSGGTLTKAPGFAWDNPNKNGAGFVMRTGRFGAVVPFVVDGTGAVYEGSQFTSDTPMLSHFTWFDGTHETTPSPTASNSLSAREAMVFSMPARAGMQKRLYLRFGTGAWTRVTLPEALTSVSWMDMLNYPSASASAPTTNTFPTATPAVLKSSIGGFQVRGDGSGSWGPLTFSPTGTMTQLGRAAGRAVSITVTDQTAGFNTATVNLPPGRFTSTPAITLSSNSSAAALVNIAVLSASATGFTIAVRRTNATPTLVDWIAQEVD